MKIVYRNYKHYLAQYSLLRLEFPRYCSVTLKPIYKFRDPLPPHCLRTHTCLHLSTFIFSAFIGHMRVIFLAMM